MEPMTRNLTTTCGLVAALALALGMPSSAQAPRQPGLPPLAVSQIEDGRRSEALALGMPSSAQAPQQPGLPPLAVSQIEDGRRSEALGQTLSLSFAEPISIRDLLLLLVQNTTLSVVLDPDVDGTFSGDLKNVTLQQAFDLVLEPHGFVAAIQGNILRVRREQLQTRLFNINYVATRRSGTRGTGLTGMYGQGAYGYGANGVGAVGVGGGYYGGGGGINGSQASVSGTDSGDVFEELQAGIETLLSDAGKLNIDRKAGLVQATDYPGHLDRIAVYIEAYETRALRQVRIVAKILEVELREEFSAGLDWSLLLKNAGDAVKITQRLAPTRGSGAFTVGLNIGDFAGLLEAFAGQGTVNVMASPWVMAMNNEPAVMRVGTQDVYFVTTSQVDASSGQILQTVVTPQTINEGVTLSVTPQITADGVINMSIMPSITERTGTATSRLGDQVPIVSVRETDTLVRVHEGETIVIAGLMQDRASTDISKVPLLGDLPLVGGLFRREERSKRKTDLVILLTPTVMTRDEITASASADEQRLYEAQRKPVRK
jgi:MSHA biogenesis protein MshL